MSSGSSPDQRLRVAAIVANMVLDNNAVLLRAAEEAGKPAVVGARLVHACFQSFLAALGGETRPEYLGIDPMSLPALQIASIADPWPPEGA